MEFKGMFKNCDVCVYRGECPYKMYLLSKGITPETYLYCPIARYEKVKNIDCSI